MTKKLNIQKINQLKTDAYENIDSYNDPDTPKALEQFSAKIKAILQADPEMLESVPEYLPVALFGRVKFSKEAKLKWAKWVQTATLPVCRHSTEACHARPAAQRQQHGLDLVIRMLGQCYRLNSISRNIGDG